jgi:hypothetical protein
VLFWTARDLEWKLADFQAYYNAARSHASLEGHTPLTFTGGPAVPMCRAEPCALGLPLWGPRPAPSRGLITNSRTNSRRTGASSRPANSKRAVHVTIVKPSSNIGGSRRTFFRGAQSQRPVIHRQQRLGGPLNYYGRSAWSIVHRAGRSVGQNAIGLIRAGVRNL